MALNLTSLGLSATITSQGISAPDYQTVLTTLSDYFRQIYGSDAYLEPDSKDGQLIALVALAIHDANNAAVATYRSFSPTTARSDALTSNVRINGIVRKPAVSSTADVVLTGTPGTVINGGSIRDANNVIWDLPPQVTLDVSGQSETTVTCRNSGPIAALAQSINQINTPTRGWMSATNMAPATVGRGVETDAQLRLRQRQSVALPSLTPFDGLDGAIANIEGVTRHKLYENDTGKVDANGLPAHSISAIVEGGDVDEIAQTLRGQKGQGVATFGNTAIVVGDKYGNPHTISFSRPANVPVSIAITIKAFTGYTSLIAQQIKAAVAAYINALGIGEDVLMSRLYSPANLGVVSGGDARYYDIQSLAIGRDPASLASQNIITAYDESATCSVDDITVTVMP